MASLVGYSHLANDLGPANFPSVDPADLASKSLNMTRKSLGHSSATLNHSFETYHTIYLYVKHILFAGFFLYNVIQILSVFPFSEWCHKYSIFDLLLDPQLLLSKFLSGIKNGLVSLSTTGEPFRMDQLNALLIVFVPLFQLFNRYILHIKSDQEEVHLFNTLCCAVQVMLFSWIYQPKVILSSPIYSLMLLFYITSTLLSMNPSRFSSIFIYTKGQLLFRNLIFQFMRSVMPALIILNLYNFIKVHSIGGLSLSLRAGIFLFCWVPFLFTAHKMFQKGEH